MTRFMLSNFDEIQMHLIIVRKFCVEKKKEIVEIKIENVLIVSRKYRSKIKTFLS